jgi:triacylglycerol esterase/lipase EstA (alpha/beta hydrolase family)
MMPRYYVQRLGGADKVRRLVGLSPSNHGTTLFGLHELLAPFQAIFGAIGCPACDQQVLPSPFLDELNGGRETVPGVEYVVIQTRYDEVVTPYSSAFLDGARVRNITLQDACPTDYTEHIGIVYDPVALQFVQEALGRNRRSFQPTCSLVWPVFSG